MIGIEIDYLRNHVTGITFTSLWLSLITSTFLAEIDNFVGIWLILSTFAFYGGA